MSKKLRDSKINVDFVLFQQGESDQIAKTTYIEYKKNLEILAKRVASAFSAPLIVAKSTVCLSGASEQIGNAIDQVAASGQILIGPDIDRQVSHAIDRYDACHLSAIGLSKASKLWAAEVLKQHSLRTHHF